MITLKTDVAVIGAGSAGLNARREAELQGAETVLIESGPYGTTCARVGCMPSKLLIAAAEVAHEIGGAGRFGIRAPSIEIDGPAVFERVRRERDRFVGFVVEDTEALPDVRRLRGRARFVGPNSLEVDDTHRVEAKSIVIAAGSSPVVPSALNDVRERVLTNDTIFELEGIPESVAVIGTGVIGLELAQALHRLGSRVTLFGRSGRLGPISDPEIQEAAAKSFGQELDIRRALNFSAELSAKGVDFHWRDENDRAHSESFAFVLAAAGRRSNIDPLGLGEAGIAVGPNGVPAFDPATCQIEGSSVFIAGDVTDDRPLLHEAADEGRIAGFNAAHFPDLHRHRRKTPLSIVFCDPQIAVVGEPAKTLDPERTEVGSVDYGDQGRARVMGQNQGKVRIYGDRSSGRLLGAEMVGPRVEHTAHLLAWVTQRGLTAAEALELPFYHPVIEEGIRTGLRDLARKLGQERPAPCARELDCGPGA